MQDKFTFSDDMEDKILACLIRHPEKFRDYFDVVRPAHFNGTHAFDVANEHEHYRERYDHFPDWTMVGNLVYARFIAKNPDRAKDCIDYVKKLAKLSTTDVDAVRDLVAAFATKRGIVATSAGK